MPFTDESTHTTSWNRNRFLTVALLVILYVLSYGPFDRLFFFGHLNGPTKEIVLVVYAPLGWVCPIGSPQGELLHRYCLLWRGVPLSYVVSEFRGVR